MGYKKEKRLYEREEVTRDRRVYKRERRGYQRYTGLDKMMLQGKREAVIWVKVGLKEERVQ